MSEIPQKPSTAAEQIIGDFSPKLVRLTDDVLFADVWKRTALSKRDRSLLTIATLITLRASDQLSSHLKRGLGNGLTQEEIAETITLLAFYAGWPAAMNAVQVARQTLEKTDQNLGKQHHV